MRTIVAGSRTISDYALLCRVMESLAWEPTVIISGHAKGIDLLGELWARMNNKPLEVYPAKWSLYGKQAGFIRNAKMADIAEACVVIWDGKSLGSKHMVETARMRGLKVYLHRTDHA